MNFLFCPPLKVAISQSRDGSRANQRDFILPNYAQDGFWDSLRNQYRADFLVAEVKNIKSPAGKVEVLQLANYLTRHGTGLVGILMTRNGLDSTARWISREQWVLHDKLIIGLGDDDIRQMLFSKQAGTDPSELIQQRIEDFRLRIQGCSLFAIWILPLRKAEARPHSATIRFCLVQDWGWRPGRVYFPTLLEPSPEDRTLALTAGSASRLPR